MLPICTAIRHFEKVPLRKYPKNLFRLLLGDNLKRQKKKNLLKNNLENVQFTLVLQGLFRGYLKQPENLKKNIPFEVEVKNYLERFLGCWGLGSPESS